jgi:hypothetical protein
MKELSDKELLELYKIIKKFVKDLNQKLEDVKND